MSEYNFSRYNFLRGWWKRIDRHTVVALGILFAMSLMLVTTAGPGVAIRIGLEESYFATRHVMYLAASIIIILTLSCFNKKLLRRFSILGFFMTLILLVLVQFYGYEVKGAKRWISFFGLNMQPSEFVKPFFAVVTGWILSLKQNYSSQDHGFPGFTISLALYAVTAATLAVQPDFGMLVMVTSVFAAQLFVSGMPFLWIMLAVVAATLGVTTAYMLLPHVAQRINNFLDPGLSENYQVTKSLMAFESGGFYGKGPGEGVVKQVLPDSHTDFIFAVAGEEFGVLVCAGIAAIFTFIVIRGLIRLVQEDDPYVVLAVTGLLVQFGLQAFINMGVTLNLLPTKGMTLPFISYGGSSSFATAISVGMLLAFTKKHVSLTNYRMKF
ncbi:MAG: putative peptidoglycan glycosyltransferase FtsW [Pseudomonadota bacterium]